MVDHKAFTKALLAWFAECGRDLPWRRDFDPYKVWVSEIMLQQTQVPRVAKDYYPRFLKTFPTVQDLAGASWEAVYPVWKGLGFYSRGKNMLKAAKLIVKKYNGQFPRDFQELQKLPGVGGYTAAAILSFAFDEKIPAIDTNIAHIIRVLWPQEKVPKVAELLVSFADSGHDWNSAMMDLATCLKAGETIPGELGSFFSSELAQQFIPKRKKPKKKEKKTTKKTKNKRRIEVGIACIHVDGQYLVQTRPKGKSFPGHWEFPGGKRNPGEDFRACVKREVLEEIGVEVSVRPHFYEKLCRFNHVDLLLRFHRCQIQSGDPKPLEKQKLDWVAPEEFGKRKFLQTNHEVLEKLKNIKG